MCSHVGADFEAVEQCIREGLQNGLSITSEASVWSRIKKRYEEGKPLCRVHFIVISSLSSVPSSSCSSHTEDGILKKRIGFTNYCQTKIVKVGSVLDINLSIRSTMAH